MAAPTAKGTARTSPIQNQRTTEDGTQDGIGTNASTNAATFGAATPRRSSGQAPAAASNADRKTFSVPLAWPKIATTAQSKSALRIFPNERLMKATSAWRIAMPDELANVVPGQKASAEKSRRSRAPEAVRYGFS
jgi:hypothetical protein